MMSLIKKNYFHILLLIIFTLPVFIFGINDLEEYQLGTFSTQIYWESFSSLFTFFYDFYGPGTKLPIGPGPLFHPLNIFLYDLKIYYIIFTFVHLFAQLHFTKKLFKLFKIEYNKNLLAVLLIFSLPNIFFGLSEDWISCFFSYCFFPVIFYYFVKIINQQQLKSYFKFSLFFSFWIINGHLGHISTYIIFLLIYFFMSIQSFDHFKRIFNIPFFISFSLIVLSISEHIYFLLRELSFFDGWKRFQGSYELRNFIEIFYPREIFLSSFALNRLPGNPILIYFGLITVFVTAFNFLKIIIKLPVKTIIQETIKLFFKSTNRNINFKICVLFSIFLIFSLLPFLSVVPSVSASYMARDIFLFLGIFILFINFKYLSRILKLLISIFLIFYSLLFFTININNKINSNENNFILNKYKNTDFINTFVNLNLSKNDYNRIYLSPNLFPEIWNGYEDDGIFAVTDLTKYNLAPFNGYFKHTSMKHFGDERNLMNGYIDSHFEQINDEFFLNLFKINYLLISEDELGLLKNFNFDFVKKITSKKNSLLLFKRKVENYSINKDNLYLLLNNLRNCKVRTLVSKSWVNEDSKLDCLFRSKELFSISNHKLKRISNGVFSIKNKEINNYPVLPFVYDINWKSNNNNIINGDNFLMMLNTDNLNKKITVIKYSDNIRYTLKILSMMSFLIIFIIIIFNKKKL
jgi:hypothetical protein